MSQSPPDSDTLRITFRSIHKQHSGNENVLTVFCPRHADVVSLSECRSCAACHGLSIDPTDRNSFLRCTWQGEGESTPEHRPLRESTLTAQDADARNTKVAEIMTTPVRCATVDMSIETLAGLLLEQGISAVPVVDAGGKAIGIVSKTDLLRQYYEEGDSEPASVRFSGSSDVELELGPGFHVEKLSRGTVADVMTHLVYSTGMDTSVARVSALMAYEGVHRVVITAQGGVAVGIVSSLDVLRWLARRDGFVIPNRTRKQTQE